ncbi:vacuolar triacylglycerol lipase [Xylaria bambusicola]|uniref:vacuolar triacylglycerol lipase n=1 Tax=Xylaria bambusicola TaxID=326684 RepID=UPI0020077664|nr:vacuolar triacylglycerol lipase [Xylaria bambusicola]KAI0506366.1 vacuolar triacylglycerol lipase [Xylaria bambusicola]
MTNWAARWVAITVFCQLLSPTAAAGLTVNTSCNTYTGVAADGVAQWLGIRYAAPPVGDLRFMPPKDPSCSDGLQLPGNTHGKLCHSTGGSPTDTSQSEDCLFLDIYTPVNTTSHSNLPVFFFIQGGGFNSLSNPNYNGRGLVKASGNNIIVVTFNYRVGPYGFITHEDEITPNNGLLDQRKALEWVHKYISSFGGDPHHVVLGGDSAGAASVSLQMAAYGGKPTDLFHAAAAESISFATVLTVEESRYLYDNFAIAAGCAGNSSLTCLRSKTAAELQAVNKGIPYPGTTASPLYAWNPVIDGDLIQNLTYDAFADGNFVKIPLIVGDDTNEGTTFAPRDASTIGASDAFLKTQFPYLTLEQLGRINSLYPNPDEDSCPSSGCYWQQVSAAYGDMRYTCPGLFISTAMTDFDMPKSYSYRYNVEDPAQVAEGLGVPHTVEVNAIFGPENVPSAPASYFPGGVNAAVVPVIQAYWTSFIRTFDPNTYKLNGSAHWETWDPSEHNRLLFETGGMTLMETVDEEMQSKCDYFYSIGVAIRQ